MVTVDVGIRFDASAESLSGLNTLSEDGVLTAGTSSQICDGAAAIMLVNDEGLKKLGLKPRAKVVALALAGDDPDKLNVNGGAMALGHPLGGTGAKLMTTLLHELERREGKYGLQAICEGGGTANAMIIERLS